MYIASQFEEQETAALHDLIAANPFGTLVTLGGGGIEANHFPFVLDRTAGEFGTLRTHVARANPVWRGLDAGAEALAIFQGANAYVSPSWYPSKHVHGKAVPTWNYVAVHAYGTMRAVDNPAWLRSFLAQLTEQHEAGRWHPWRIDDAPADFIDQLLTAIVGIEIPLSRLAGKWKVSQNRSESDRQGVAAGLRSVGGEQALAMADAVSRQRKP